MGRRLPILRATHYHGHPARVAIACTRPIEKYNWTGFVGVIIFTPSQRRDD